MRKLLLLLSLSLCAHVLALDDGNYLVRNVATGKYWGAGNDWGTRASLVENPEYVTWVRLNDGKYHLESQVNNGGSQFYFNGDYMDNGTPVALTIEQRANGYYTIGNGGIYYGYDGSTTVLGKTETDATSPNVQWEIISVADATSALATATQTNPMNATFLVGDANFGRNNRWYDKWTFEASNKNNEGDVTNFCVESWHATFTMSQTISVPNGIYGLQAQGFYRQDGNDNDHLPVFFANEATCTFPVMKGSENSMSDASASFSQGMYTIAPIIVTVENGELTIGARLEENYTLWCIWDNFTLWYYGADTDAAQIAFDTRFKNLLDRVNELLLCDGLTAEGKRKLDAALTAYKGINKNSTEEQQQTVENTISEAIKYAEDGFSLVQQLTTEYNQYNDMLIAAGSHDETTMALLATIGAALVNNAFDSNSQIEGWLASLTTVRHQYFPYEYTYWFDTETTIFTGVSSPLCNFEADVSSLTEGLHSLSIQVAHGDTLSAPRTYLFVRTPLVENLDNMECLFWVDGELFCDEQVSSSNGTMAWTIDVSSLSEGVHQYMLQTIMPSGVCSDYRQGTFLFTTQQDVLDEMKCYYIVDGANATTIEATAISNGFYHFDLDVSALSDGLHHLSYWLIGSNGSCTAIKTAYFTKIPLGGSGITEFWYWLNDLDGQKRITTYEPRQDTVSIISLLPVETQPIRSCNFQFAIKDGSPLIYAKNEFHIRFWDVSKRMTEATREYVDERVSEDVFPVGELHETQTFPKVGNNDIRWYTVYAEPGDTLAFKSSQACTMQLFSPSGKELYAVSGAESVTFGGIHTWESGTHYLAVHDVTGTRSTMTLDYMHMDKYDVVEWDVHTVGNGGYNTITFKGNGFRDLYCVDLYNAIGDTIHSIDVGHEKDAETSVTFNFTNTNLGTYNALFHFTIEDVEVSNIVVIEEPIDIILETEVSFPSTFKHGGSTTYTIKITNKGNMTAYSVPIYTWIMNKINEDGIYHIQYDGLGLQGIFDGLDTDSLSAEEINELQILNKQLGDDHHFLKFKVEDENNPNDSIHVRSNYFFTNIGAYETKILRLTISANESVWAYFTVPENWPSYSSVEMSSDAKYVRARFKAPSALCSWDERLDCLLSTASFYLDMGSAVSFVFGPQVAGAINAADCGVSVASSINKSFKILACGEDGSEDDLKSMIGNAAKSAVSAAISCVATKLSKYGIKYLKMYNGNYANLGTGLSALVAYIDRAHPTDGDFSCFKSWTKPRPGCPPPPPNGGASEGGMSFDPNEIYGYLSESGTKYLADSVARVNYTIEFENDTALATASAHTIVIRDTLDSRYFDLGTFTPMSVKIGNHTEQLDGNPEFVKTIDMRPEINAIAQVTGEYDPAKGIATWTFQSLDPMTMEPTDDVMQGILPVNYDGTSGIGEVLYEIGVKQGKADGTEVNNRASIVFDYEAPILTPTWTNIVDAIPPTSCIMDGSFDSDSTIVLTLQGEDNRSGIWYYDVYAQQGKLAPWILVAEHLTGPQCTVTCFEDIEYGFCVVATDSAGNVERKVLTRELSLEDRDIETGLTETQVGNGSEATYDLSGRRIDPRRPGIYIRRGKKSLNRP
ncbi:MAG: hypothetical protein IJ064_04420 [Bacteroidaceae bacterium]|nr:hypothetical protein [Bacteroidaceae bacterium]